MHTIYKYICINTVIHQSIGILSLAFTYKADGCKGPKGYSVNLRLRKDHAVDDSMTSPRRVATMGRGQHTTFQSRAEPPSTSPPDPRILFLGAQKVTIDYKGKVEAYGPLSTRCNGVHSIVIMR